MAGLLVSNSRHVYALQGVDKVVPDWDLHSLHINHPPLHQVAGITTSWLLYFKLLEELGKLSLLANCVNNTTNFSKLYRLVTTRSLQKKRKMRASKASYMQSKYHLWWQPQLLLFGKTDRTCSTFEVRGNGRIARDGNEVLLSLC